MASESPGRRKLAQSVADHRLIDKNLNKYSAIMNPKIMTDKFRRNLGGPSPSLDWLSAAILFLPVDLYLQFFVDVWSFFG
jgi:hypothetical protein